MRRAAGALVVLAALLASCSGDDDERPARDRGGAAKAPGSARVSVADLGARWPLTVRAGTIRCEEEASVIFRVAGRSDYGVNAAAVRRGLPPLDDIWRRDPDRPRDYVDITPLLDRGLRLCDPPQGTLSDTRRNAGERARDTRGREHEHEHER